MRRALSAALLLVVLLAAAATARAQNAPPLTGSDYNLDLYQGTIIGSTRMVGMGGAYTAIAEGSEGISFNPAAVANRSYFSTTSFDWTFHVDFMLGNAFGIGEADFDNNGRAGVGDGSSYLLTAGLLFQWGSFGVGLSANWQQFDLGQLGGASVGYTASLLDARLSAGYGFLDHQLILAGGLRVGSLTLALSSQSNESLFDVSVIGLEAGALWRPKALPLRIGAAVSVPFDSAQGTSCAATGQDGPSCPAGFFLPSEVTLPWEVRIGAAYRIGVGRFNPTPQHVLDARAMALKLARFKHREAAKREREQRAKRAAKKRAGGDGHAGAETLPSSQPGSQPTSAPASGASTRPTKTAKATTKTTPSPKRPKVDLDRDYRGGRYILVSAEVVIIGPSDNAIGPDGFAEQRRERVGESVAISVRLGAESEILRRRLRLRVGSYWEPGRYEGYAGRIHGTASLLLRLFDFNLWGHHSLAWAPSVDVASDFFNLSFLVSFWH